MKTLFVIECRYLTSDGYIFTESLGFFDSKEKAEHGLRKQMALWGNDPEEELNIVEYPMNELVD